MKHVQDLCEQSQDNLSSVLSSMCTLGDPEAKAIVKEIVQDVAVRKGVRKGVEELVGDETFSKYMESLQEYWEIRGKLSLISQSLEEQG